MLAHLLLGLAGCLLPNPVVAWISVAAAGWLTGDEFELRAGNVWLTGWLTAESFVLPEVPGSLNSQLLVL